jgi:hypothetical protein
MSEKLKSTIAVIGTYIGKNSFHVVGQDNRGAIVLWQKWSRACADRRSLPEASAEPFSARPLHHSAASPAGHYIPLPLHRCITGRDRLRGWGELPCAVRTRLTSLAAVAETIMGANPDIQDVFVTETGKKDEPMLGWITNAMMAHHTA